MDPNAVVEQLDAELRALRKSRGVDADVSQLRVGDTLRAACGITDSDGLAEVRRKVVDRLESLAGELPDDQQIAVRTAFGLIPEARAPFLRERVRWAAEQLDRDERTVRRRIDQGTRRLAELAAARLSPPARPGGPSEAELWHTKILRTMLNLTLSAPEAFEFRRIVADQDGVREIDLAVTLTAPPPDAASPASALVMDVLYGGSLVRRSMESEHRFGMALALPYPLNRGAEHEFAVRFRVPDGETIRPHFVAVPRLRCDHLEVRVKFDEKKLPTAVWQLTKVFQDELDDPARRTEPVAVDSASELRIEFDQPAPGFAYGVQWDEEPEIADDRSA
ncbi:MAG TPA: hypothetical protein VG756_19375 [Pseudonocardiaceae bacterium]|jgi:hypothetical protein|nr:hypothetical protein [Pseudonocardiaceae bacterium]